jgi:DNA-binding transcriptional regulator YhcF (GntR family)
MSAPPFRRIAAQLTQRIASGALPPGSRLPSVRELAREHCVATATAAHALRELAGAGLVKPIARSGHVVVGVRTRSAEPARSASSGDTLRGEVIRAGIVIADEEGLATLSIRGIAAKVGVPPMSLYRHVANKQQLLRLMADAAFAEEQLPRPARTWQVELEQCARLEWRLFRRHPWLARVVIITRPTALPRALAFADRTLGALAQAGFAPADALRIHIVLHGFVQGLAVNLEAELEALGESGITDEEWVRSEVASFARLATAERLPHFLHVLEALSGGFDLDFDDVFETGLRTLLDGLTARSRR